MKARIAWMLATILFSQVSLSQEATIPRVTLFDESLGLLHNVSLSVNDNITGGCWTNAEAIKQKTRLTLEQSGISVHLQPMASRYPYNGDLQISAFGGRSAAGRCLGHIEIAIVDIGIRTMANADLVGEIVYFSDSAIAAGEDLNDQFASHVEKATNELAATILSSRRHEKVAPLLELHEKQLKAQLMTWDDYNRSIDQ